MSGALTTAPAPKRRGRLVVALFAAVMLLVVGASLWSNLARQAEQAAARPASTDGLEELTITGATGRHVFRVEVMRDEARRQKGLMFRQHLPPDRGMLFDFEKERQVSMWMKNTLIPLDMLFVRANGIVARIEERAEPLSERSIPSGHAVQAVIELDGGTAARLGIKPGDRVRHPLFGTR